MKNLAGDKMADATIEAELTAVGIEVVEGERSRREVEAKFTGRLGALTFTRLWYYWEANGAVPLAVARELYADPVGYRDVRADGSAGNRKPAKDVRCYHTDSAEGLRLFADTMRRHGLAPVSP